jgi:hypothetical protein
MPRGIGRGGRTLMKKMFTLGVALIAVGVAALATVPANFSAQMDRVDAAGTSGDIFEFGILPLGVLALAAIIAGVVVAARALAARERAGAHP